MRFLGCSMAVVARLSLRNFLSCSLIRPETNRVNVSLGPEGGKRNRWLSVKRWKGISLKHHEEKRLLTETCWNFPSEVSLFLLRRVYRFTKEKRLAKDCSQRGNRKSTTRPRKKWNFSLTRTRLFFSPACSVERCRRHLSSLHLVPCFFLFLRQIGEEQKVRRKQTFLVIERITRDGSPCSRVALAHLIPSRFFLELIPPTKIFERSSREKREGLVPLCFGRNDKNFPREKSVMRRHFPLLVLQLLARFISFFRAFIKRTRCSRGLFTPSQSQCLPPCSFDGPPAGISKSNHGTCLLRIMCADSRWFGQSAEDEKFHFEGCLRDTFTLDLTRPSLWSKNSWRYLSG